MLKSFTTQLAATMIFGPVGLAYTSLATAVFLTLVLAVLYFTSLGPLAFFVIWPISIITGFSFIKLHNDRIRQAGSSLLLGPGDRADTALGSLATWVRGAVVLLAICFVGYLMYFYLPASDSVPPPGRIVPESVPARVTVGEPTLQPRTATSGSVNPQEVPATIGNSGPVITLPSQDIPTIVVNADGDTAQAASSNNGGIVEQKVLFVDRNVVNLRQGPGTQFDIVAQMDFGDELLEFARDGDWINVETKKGNNTGWVYATLVRR